MEIKSGYTQTNKRHIIEYSGVEYTREEAIIDNYFHTIKWYTGSEFDDTYQLREYYAKERGWSDSTGHMNKKAPMPTIETVYQALIN